MQVERRAVLCKMGVLVKFARIAAFYILFPLLTNQPATHSTATCRRKKNKKTKKVVCKCSRREKRGSACKSIFYAQFSYIKKNSRESRHDDLYMPTCLVLQFANCTHIAMPAKMHVAKRVG